MLKVLIVDDDKIIRKGLIKIISRKCPEVIIAGEATNGKNALHQLEQLDVNVVITDIKMPIMDGTELVEEISKLYPNIITVVLSGFDDYKYVRSVMKKGAVDYLLKPISEDELERIFKEAEEKLSSITKEELILKEVNESLNGIENLVEEKYLLKLIYNSQEFIKEGLSRIGKDNFDKDGKFRAIVIGRDIFSKMIIEKEPISNIFDSLKLELVDVIRKAGLSNKTLFGEVKGNIAIIIKYEEPEEIKDCIKILLNAINTEDISASVGISEEYGSITVTEKYFPQALKALSYRFYFGFNSIIDFNEIKERENSVDLQKINELEEALIKSIEICKSKEVKGAVERIITFLAEKNVPPDVFRRKLHNIISAIIALIPEVQYFNEESDENKILFIIDNLQTLWEMKTELPVLIYKMSEEIKDIRLSRSTKIIELAKTYIEENYDRELTLKEVAEEVYLNPNYFSELFKAQTGKNFIDYLIEKRIKSSQEMLRKSTYKIYQVAEMVGYQEVTSFNRAFKKVVGISPSEYIKLVK
ncbi:response regulator transcription factor [Clostridium cellulovorans]|uniref:Stage 0 sporulation protein A homolog n=1 Tax=Clostridium cellulovorans (strain ATCC 35296 / DSM 3052 / OCM 3 / 743B) TaxID=573061 RepID=D9SUD3_CLOC7|nr:response regulator [Clostridium cellulovorans]ADL52888.1 two component transcriptional regulator, AraC family [Clostridium cellulovorans 743B]